MSRCSDGLSVRRGMCLFIGIASILLTACAPSMTRLPIGPSPLVMTSCPASLGALRDDSFGATSEKLVWVAGVYFRCRAAAMAGDGVEK